MGRRLFVLSMFLVFVFQQAKACDACGCSISGGGIGLMSAYRYNFVGLQWHYAGFKTLPGHGQGRSGLFFSTGLQIKKGKWLTGISYSQPIQQSYSHDEVDASGRFSCQLFYIF